jgi:hypothetical protein
MNDNIIPCVIQGGYNTSYIIALLTSLFYKKNENIRELLNKIPKKPEGYYLQEMIKINYIDPLCKNYTIKNDIINEIRNYLLINGYLKNLNIYDSMKNNDINLLYEFIIDFLNGNTLQFEILKIKDGQVIDKNKFYNTTIINIDITEKETSIRQSFINWIDNILLKNDSDSYTYELSDMPLYISFYFNRIEKESMIDIMKNIKFFKNCNPTQNCIKYKIHSLICKSSNEYYSILINNGKWIMCKENNIPSLEYIELNDYEQNDKIKKEVIFVIYSLD